MEDITVYYDGKCPLCRREINIYKSLSGSTDVSYIDIEAVNFDYANKLTAVNAINLASIAWAPPAVSELAIGGIIEASARFKWSKTDDPNIKGYRIYWRDTTSPTWDHSRYVGDVSRFLLEGILIDNFFFGVAAVGKDGHESVIVFPSKIIRKW